MFTYTCCKTSQFCSLKDGNRRRGSGKVGGGGGGLGDREGEETNRQTHKQR